MTRADHLLRWLGGFICLALMAATGPDEKGQVEPRIANAEAMRDAGNLPAAVIELKAVLAKEPANLPARLLLAQIYIDLDHGDVALGMLNRAEHSGASEQEIAKPRAEAALAAHRYKDVLEYTATPAASLSSEVEASLLATRAEALAAFSRDAEAKEALEAGLRRDPHSVDVRLASARLALAHGDLRAARAELAAAARDTAKDRRVGQLQAAIAVAAQDYAEAERIYRGILDAEPWNELVRGDLAAVQVARKKPAEAIETLDAILKDPLLADVPKPPILKYVRAVAALQQQDFKAAQENAQAVLQIFPEFEPADLIAGASSYALHEYKLAESFLLPYASRHGEDIEGLKLLAATQLALGHASEAAKTLAPLRGKAGADPDLLSLLGAASAHAGDVRASNRYMQRLLELRPDDWRLRAEAGLAAMRAGDPKTAVANLEEVVKARPGASAALLPLAIALLQEKEYAKALAIADQMITSEPESPTGQLLAAAAYLGQSNRQAARAALEKARQIHPGDINANNNLAKLALAEGRVDDARRYYEDTLSANRQSIQTYLQLAALHTATGDPQDAESLLRGGIAANPTVPELTAALLRLQLAHGEGRQVLEGARKALATFAGDAAFLDLAGRAQLALNKPEAALATFRKLLRVAPERAATHVDLAEAYLALYKPDRPQWSAISEAQEAVRLAPDDVGAKLTLARALVIHARLEDAAAVVGQLKAANPNSVDAVELEGLIARGQNRHADAAAAFAQALKLGDNRLDRRRLAVSQIGLGHLDEGAKALEPWVAAHPQDAELRKMLAGIYVKAERFSDAGKEFAALVEQIPGDSVAQNDFAWVLLRLGKADEALTHARIAVSLAAGSADNLDTLGMIQLDLGHPAEAIGPLEEASRKEPARPEITFHLSQALAALDRKSEALALLRRLLAPADRFAERDQARDLLRSLGGRPD